VSESKGTVVLASNPRGAVISVDGRDTRFVTPHTFKLDAGDHEFSLSKDGYKPETVSVSVESGRSIDRKIELAGVSPNLPPEPSKPTTTTTSGGIGANEQAGLEILTTPAGLEISIDGKPQGKSPVKALLGPGKHDFTYACPGSDTETRTVNVNAGSIATKMIQCAE
jgi:hypothetical protein